LSWWRRGRAAIEESPNGARTIAYSLFEPADLSGNERFVFDKYLLGVYFNARMNRLLYPGWRTVLYADERLLERHGSYFDDIAETCGRTAVDFVGRSADAPLWELVLSRMAPLFDGTTARLLCRDLDSIATYREAQAVAEWIQSGTACHAISDNVMHLDPLMAGMCGFDVAQFRAVCPEYDGFESLVRGFDLSWRGSDQRLLRERVWPRCRARALAHCLDGRAGADAAIVRREIEPRELPGVRTELWESNLVVGFIGQAGVNEMEILRFFRRHDDDARFYEFEDAHADICYWRR
jgi:hypothetical protein